MSGNIHHWEEEFSRYELDMKLPIEESSSSNDFDIILQDTDFGLSSHTGKEPSSPLPANDITGTTTEEAIQKTDMSQESSSEELSNVNSSADNDQYLPRPSHRPMSAYDMNKLWGKLTEAIDSAIPLRDQAQKMLEDHNNIKFPKGLRTTYTLLYNIVDVLMATKAITDLYLFLQVPPLYQNMEECGLKTASYNTMRTLKAHVPTMQEGLDDVEKAMAEGNDRPSANLRMRIVKAQAKMIETMAIQQAQTLAQTIEAFPLEYGSLRLFCLIEERGDKEIMKSIDRVMEIAEHVQVPVADAPAMLEAVQNNDQKAVDAIVAKILQH